MSVVVGVGAAVLDIVAAVPRFPRPDEKLKAQSLVLVPGGNCLNSCVCLARLGVRASLVSKVGSDAFADQIRRSLQSEGVDSSLLVAADCATPISFIIAEEQNKTRTCIGPRSLQLTAEDRAPVEALDGCRLLLLGFSEMLELADVVVTNSEFPLSETRKEDLLAAMCELLQRKSGEYRRAVVTTLGSAGSLRLSVASGDCPGLARVRTLEEVKGVANSSGSLAVTRMMYTHDRGEFALLHCSVLEGLHVVDTNGAGDAFVGATAFGVLRGLSDESSLRLASFVAEHTELALEQSARGATQGSDQMLRIIADNPKQYSASAQCVAGSWLKISCGDAARGAKLFKMAADQGYSPAQWALGVCLERGEGVEKDEREAVRLFKQAADQGHAYARLNLAMGFSSGAGTKIDKKEAARQLRLAADQGLAMAHYQLGIALSAGMGLEKNEFEAVRQLRLAASQGLAVAQNALGECIENGRGSRRNELEALKLYQQAAEQGLPAAIRNIGLMPLVNVVIPRLSNLPCPVPQAVPVPVTVAPPGVSPRALPPLRINPPSPRGEPLALVEDGRRRRANSDAANLVVPFAVSGSARPLTAPRPLSVSAEEEPVALAGGAKQPHAQAPPTPIVRKRSGSDPMVAEVGGIPKMPKTPRAVTVDGFPLPTLPPTGETTGPLSPRHAPQSARQVDRPVSPRRQAAVVPPASPPTLLLQPVAHMSLTNMQHAVLRPPSPRRAPVPLGPAAGAPHHATRSQKLPPLKVDEAKASMAATVLEGNAAAPAKPQQQQQQQQQQRQQAQEKPAPAVAQQQKAQAQALQDKRRHLTADQIAAASRIYQYIDRSGKNRVDVDELHALLKVMNPYITLPDTNRIYHSVDARGGAPGNSHITIDEFLQMIEENGWDLVGRCQSASPAPVVAEKPGALQAPAPVGQPALVAAVAAALPAAGLQVGAPVPVSVSPSQSILSTFEWEIPFRDIKLETKLGEGSFGIVYKGKWQGLLRSSVKEEAVADFRSEIALMSKMRHPNIVLFMGASTSNTSRIAIVTEFVSAGSLHNIVHKHWRSLKFEWLLKANYDIAVGMAYLHSLSPPIVHRDLKPMNILVDGESGRIKLIDFGLSMAPEVLRNETYTEKVDVYSFALVVFEVFTRETPYINMDVEQIKEAVGYKALRPKMPETVPAAIKELIQKCWSQLPESRPSFKDIINQPIFRNVA
eukprot:m51a1_g5626 putative flag-tagged protein kinase domain of mitogen-activated protein kinase kinase kinase (1200) ;mRNA; f:791973-798029